MRTFDELAAMPGVGCIYYFDVALDPTAVNPYTLRYATEWFSSENYPSSLDSQPRIAALGGLTRALAETRSLTSSTITVTLENSDGGVDWIADQATYLTQAIQSEWRLTCLLYDPAGAVGDDYAVKVLGIFTLMDPPTRNSATIEITLSDQLLNRLDMDTPSIADWCGITDANRPFTLAQLLNPSRPPSTYKPANPPAIEPFDPYTPLPLAWGWGDVELTYITTSVFVACVVPGTSAGLPTPFSQTIRQSDGFVIPTGIYGATTLVTWRRSPTITKNGKDWHIMWAQIDFRGDTEATPGDQHAHIQRAASYFARRGYADPNADPGANDFDTKFAQVTDSFNYYQYALEFGPFTATGLELLSHNADDLPELEITAAQVVSDILTQCVRIPLTVSGVSSVKALRPVPVIKKLYRSSTSYDNGSWRELSTGETVSELRKLCEVGNFDLFFKWDGTAAVNALGADYTSQSATLASLDETLISSITERIPGMGERNAPVNRIYITSGGETYGPLNNAGTVQAWGRVIARSIDGSWMPRSLGRLAITPNSVHTVDPVFADYVRREVAPRADDTSVARPTLHVVTGLNGLSYELCDYITVTWTRGDIGSPYLNSVFRVEGIALSPFDGRVELTLVWCDDLRKAGNLPYILDDETLYLRKTASGGRTCTLTDASTTIAFSSGSLITDGVLAGDVLIVSDPTEAATAFKRNRTIRVVSITDATHFVGDVSDFGSGGPFVITAWTIQKGALTSGRATYYGKTCGVTGNFYDGSPANRILEG